MSAERIAAGEGYARRHFGVFSVWSPTDDGTCRCPAGKACANPGKHPIPPDGFKSATTDVKMVKAMLGAASDPNIGIVPPEGVFGWDIDGEGRERFASLERQLGDLPDTMTTETANGMHLFFRWPDGVQRPSGNLLGFVTRWGGANGTATGYLLGAGSRHASGFVYATVRDATGKQPPIAVLPPAWVAAATTYAQAPTSWANSHAEKVPEGTRHDYLRDQARNLRGKGLTGGPLFDAVMALNVARCDPPKSAQDVRRAIGEVESRFPADLIATPGKVPMPNESLGTRTAADLSFGSPAPQLVAPYLDPEGPTLIYGKGGVGKGVFACWLIKYLVEAGHVVMILDFEGHEREWGSRLRGLGLPDALLARVHYRAPYASDWIAPTGPLSAVSPAVRSDCERLGVTYLVVDSYSPATSNGDVMGGEQAAREYFITGLVRLGLPSLTIAHVRGDAPRFPDRPFGSVFVHNYARETWCIETDGTATEITDEDEASYGPHVVKIELRNMKASGRAKARSQFLSFGFYADGSLEVSTDRPAERPLADMIDAVLSGAMTITRIAAAIREDYDRKVVPPDTIAKTLKRHSQRFVLANEKRPQEWKRR